MKKIIFTSMLLMSSSHSAFSAVNLTPDFDVTDGRGNPMQPHYDLKAGDVLALVPSTDSETEDLIYTIETNSPDDIMVVSYDDMLGLKALHAVDNATVTITASSDSLGTDSDKTIVVSVN